jgi:4-hydroxythreonine-4-phosphate dehydrogenase
LLFAIGSTSSTTRAQYSHLLASPAITAVEIAPQSLLEGPASTGWQQVQEKIAAAIANGDDVAMITANDTLLASSMGPDLANALGQLLAPCREAFGGLVATGGETARAVLSAWDISALRLLREVEPGLPLSITEGWSRPLPVITKAGAFGPPTALLHCRAALRELLSLQSESTL